MNFIFTIVYIFSVITTSNLPSSVDFHHKKISKEISKVLDLDDYDLIEIESIRHLATNNEILGKYFLIMLEEDRVGLTYIGRVFTCPGGGCDENINSSQTSEYFDYMILYDQNKELKSILVTNYQATHGQEVCSKGWLRQFNGFKGGTELKVGKNIDSISGATRSTYSITEDITKRTIDIQNL